MDKAECQKGGAGQLVVHGRNRQIREYGTYRMTRIQDPPKKSRLAGPIARAVGKVALERVQSDPALPVTTRLRSSDVFINCPFDPGYRPSQAGHRRPRGGNPRKN